MILDYFKNTKKEIDEINYLLQNTDVFNENLKNTSIDKNTLFGLNMGYSDGQMTSGYSSAIEKLAGYYKEATAEANALKMAQDGLSESTVKDILAKQNWSEEARKNAVDSKSFKEAQHMATLSINENTAATWKNVVCTKALTVAKKALSVVSGIVAGALLSVATTAILSFFTKLIDKIHTTKEEYKELLDEAKSDYESIESELESLNDELETANSRMEELKNKGNLSFTEKEEYDNLVKQNNELERKIALLEKEEALKKEEINQTFVDAVDDKIDFDYKLNDYKSRKKELEEAEKIDIKKLDATDAFELETYKENLRYQLENLSKDLWEELNDFEGFADGVSYVKNPTTDLEREVNDKLDMLYDLQDYMAISDGVSNSKTNAFNRLVDNWQFDEATQGLQDLGQEGKVTASTIEEALKDPDDKLELFIDKLVEIGVIDSKDNLEDIASAFNKVAEEAEKASNKLFSKEQMISALNGMSEGFEEMDKIYESIKDDDPFDFKLLDDKNFKETFSGLDGYADFFETITNNADDINACKGAFNDLITEWLYSSDVLSNVTEENAGLTTAMLKQMGVANAEEVVTAALAKAKAHLAAEEEFLAEKKRLGTIESENLEEATYEELSAIIQEGNASEATRQYLANLALSKVNVNNAKISTKSDIDQIVALANASGAASGYVYALRQALDNLQNKSKTLNKYRNSSGNISYLSSGWQMEVAANGNLPNIIEEEFNAQKEVEKAFAEVQKHALDAADYYVPVDYGGGNSSNKDSSSGSESEEIIDHIATKIERLERKIESLGKTASATYKDWKERNNALSEQIELTTEEIALQEEALAYYEKKANAIGLSSEYQDLVKHGAIRIDIIKDEKLKKKIEEFKELYEKSLDCKDAIDDLNTELASLAKQRFDNISSEFDNLLSSVEHEMSVLEAYIDQTETRGHIVSAKYYDSLIEAEKKNIELLEQEYAKLTEELSNAMKTGDIKEGSEDWHAMKDSINEVKLEIIEANTSLIEFGNSIRDLEWENFDRLQEKISAITDETEFLISLMEDSELYDDNGQLTDTGMATMGLHAQNYNVLMNQADQYADEIEKINADLANDPNNQDLLDRKQELIELQRESILAANDEKMAIKDMVQEGINLELEALQERIDKIKETQDEMQTLYEYQKKVAEQTKNIASLEKQLVAYEGDDSEENQAKIQQIKVELEEARKSLEETETEYAISETQKMLDNLYSEYEEILNTRLDDIDALLSDIIAEVNNNASNISETLNAQTEAVGATLSENMQSIWGNDGCATGIITKYGDNFNSQLTSVNNVLNAIATSMGAIVEESDKEAENIIKEETPKVEPQKPAEPKPETPTNTPSKPSQEEKKEITVGGKIDAGSAKIYDYAGDTTGETQYYKNDPKYVVLKEKDGYLQVRHHSLKSGISGWFKKKDVKAYKTGGLAEETGLAWLDGTKSKPEMVLNAKDTKNYMELTDILRKATRDDSILFDNDKFMKNIEELSSNLKPEFNSFIAKLPHMNTEGFMGNMNNVFNMNFELHEVQSGRDVVNFLIKDKTFENAIQAMTVDRLAGGSKFAKSKYYKG